MISDTADRNALLRYLDLMNDLSDIANEYADLGVMVVATAMKSKAYEAMGCAMLPQAYRPPPTQSQPLNNRETDSHDHS